MIERDRVKRSYFSYIRERDANPSPPSAEFTGSLLGGKASDVCLSHVPDINKGEGHLGDHGDLALYDLTEHLRITSNGSVKDYFNSFTKLLASQSHY